MSLNPDERQEQLIITKVKEIVADKNIPDPIANAIISLNTSLSNHQVNMHSELRNITSELRNNNTYLSNIDSTLTSLLILLRDVYNRY